MDKSPFKLLSIMSLINAFFASKSSVKRNIGTSGAMVVIECKLSGEVYTLEIRPIKSQKVVPDPGLMTLLQETQKYFDKPLQKSNPRWN